MKSPIRILATMLLAGVVSPEALAVPRQDASAPAEAASPADAAVKALQAIVMDVQGKARWRPSPDAEWRDAKVNDIVEPGTEVRTGLRSRLTMRVGRNATVLVDAGTTFEMPEVLEEAGQLRTTATVRSGRVDFKVDKLDGFANDFKVVTPQTTLAVRGTGFSLATGPLQGFEVTGARTNMLNAIELKYVAQNVTYFVSGEGKSSSDRQDPVQNAWVSTVGPPPIVGALVNNQQLTQQVAQGNAGNAPTNPQQQQQIAAAETYGQAGGTLVVAANEPGASGSIQNLAVDATGRADIVTNPVDGKGTDVADELPSGSTLRTALLFARSEVARLRDDAATVASASDAAVDLSTTLSNRVAQYQPYLVGISSASADTLIEEALDQGAADQGDEQHNIPSTTVSGSGMPGALWGQVNSFQQSSGAAVFTTRPGTTGGLRPSTDNGGGPRVGIATALDNAMAWSDHDLGLSNSALGSLRATALVEGRPRTDLAGEDRAMIGDDLVTIRDLAERWAPDRNRPGSNSSATQIALNLNERIQQLWGLVLNDALAGNQSFGDIAVTQGALRTAIATLRTRMGRVEASGVGPSSRDFRKAFALEATSAGTSAATRASNEVASLAASAESSALAALENAEAAFDAAGQARSRGHQVFFNALGNNNIKRAASLAYQAQTATNAIVSNAFDMQRNYNNGHSTAASVNAVPPNIDQGLGSVTGGGGR